MTRQQAGHTENAKSLNCAPRFKGFGAYVGMLGKFLLKHSIMKEVFEMSKTKEYDIYSHLTDDILLTVRVPSMDFCGSHTISEALDALENARSECAKLDATGDAYLPFAACELYYIFDYDGMETTLTAIEMMLDVDTEWILDEVVIDELIAEYRELAEKRGMLDITLL